MNINFKNGNEEDLYTLKEIKEDFAKIISIAPTKTIKILSILDKIFDKNIAELENIKKLVPKDKEVEFNRYVTIFVTTTIIIKTCNLQKYKPEENTYTIEQKNFELDKKLIENILNILTDEEFILKTLEMIECYNI